MMRTPQSGIKTTTGKIDRIIGGNLAALRAARGLTQRQIAQMLGVSFQQVQKYENGANRLSAASLYNLHRALNVPLARFYEGCDSQGKTKQPPVTRTDKAAIMLFNRLAAMKNPRLRRKIIAAANILAAP